MTLLEGKTPKNGQARPEIFVRCKIAARGTSDWHGLILGGRALDCAGRMGLGFRPGPETHVLDTLGVQIPRCEDLTQTRKDRAYAFKARLSSLDDPTSREPGGEDREFLRFDGEESLQLVPGMASLSPSGGMRRRPPTAPCPKWWSAQWRRFRGSGRQEPRKEEDASLSRETWSPRSVRVSWRPPPCECGAVETVFRTEPQADSCKSCGVSKLAKHEESCFACESSERVAARELLGMLLLLAVLRMGAERSEDRGYLPPCRSFSPFELYRRERLARNSGRRYLGGTRQGAKPPFGREGPKLRTWEAWTPRRSPSRLACSRSQVSPGRSGILAICVRTRARSLRTRFLLQSASRSSGQDAGRSGQAGRLAPRPVG